MICLDNFIASSHVLNYKFYLKCSPYSLQSVPDLHLITRFMGELFLASVHTNRVMKKGRFKCHAMDLAKEPHIHEQDNVPYELGHRLPESLSWLLASPDKVNRLALLRKQWQQEWTVYERFGVILEWEGVVVEDDDPDLEPQVWYLLSLEEGKSHPPDSLLKKIEGIKTDQAISEVLCWSDDPTEVQRLAARKEVIHRALRGRYYRLRPGALDFMNTLIDFSIPIAIVSTLPQKSLQEGISVVGLQGYFDVAVAAEDVCRGKPEAEMFELAAKHLGLKPESCVVFGNSNLTTESAHSAGMRCVAVASRRPVYKLRAADHVVRWLDELSFSELQRLADGEPIGRRARALDMEMEILTEE